MNQPRALSAATLGALGVVYGDIGTSPLYALREATAVAGGTADVTAMLGVLSLIFWSLLIIITLKYIVVILRMDNDGEGGVLSLVALVENKLPGNGKAAQRLVLLAVLGTAFFYCDALITPAISVLGAIEGLAIIDPGMQRLVVPVTLVILVALFALQRRGTERIGRLFGPIMVIWFVSIGLLGLRAIIHTPEILTALNPVYALHVLQGHPGLAMTILGAVFLVLTGGEALYIDMGHFGRKPVRIAWFLVVWPGLLLNYFGQGALLLTTPSSTINPFFALASPSALPFLVLLATAAAIIASQATISGAFSVTRQAVQLDLLPRVKILQTSEDAHGQIYVPAANAFMFFAVCAFVLIFQGSSGLSGAYGAAVNGTMVITTLLGAIAARAAWKWPIWRITLVFGLFAIVDLAFVLGNATKIPSGGWIPLALSAAMFARLRHLARRTGKAARRTATARGAHGGTAGDAEGRGTRSRHGGLSRQPSGLRADRDAPEPRAQPRLPRDNRDPAPRDPAHAATRRRLAQLSRGSPAGHFRRARAIRIHGDAGREGRARRRGAQGTARRRGLHLLPRLAPRAGAGAPGHCRHEDAALCMDAEAERPGCGILPHANEAGRRARNRSRDLALASEGLDCLALLYAEPQRSRRAGRRQRHLGPERRPSGRT